MRVSRSLHKLGLVLVASVAAAALVTPNASAVVNGQPDQGQHPYVGTLVLQDKTNGSYHYWCSGTMISARVFLAAGHCMSAGFLEYTFPGSEIVGLTLNPVVAPADNAPEPTPLYSGEPVTAPGWPGKSWTLDVGVYVLDEPLSGLPALPVIPDEGQLDTMGLTGQEVTLVGYGATRDKTGGPNGLATSTAGTRLAATQRITGVSPRWIHLLGNAAAGAGGMCYGDSGAPRLLEVGDRTMVIATSWWLGKWCQAPEMALRLDTPTIHAFLQDAIQNNR